MKSKNRDSLIFEKFRSVRLILSNALKFLSASQKLGSGKSGMNYKLSDLSLFAAAMSNKVSVKSLCQMFVRVRHLSLFKYFGNLMAVFDPGSSLSCVKFTSKSST